jgi:hypothetical protein
LKVRGGPISGTTENKTSDKHTFDHDDDETSTESAQTPATMGSWSQLQPPMHQDVQRPHRSNELLLQRLTLADLKRANEDDRGEYLSLYRGRQRSWKPAPPIRESAQLARQRAVTETEYVDSWARQWLRVVTPRWDDPWRHITPSSYARVRRLYRRILRDDDLFDRVERRVRQLVDERDPHL